MQGDTPCGDGGVNPLLWQVMLSLSNRHILILQLSGHAYQLALIRRIPNFTTVRSCLIYQLALIRRIPIFTTATPCLIYQPGALLILPLSGID